MKKIGIFLFTVLSATLLLCYPAYAGMREAGYGPRAVGMGQAQIAASNDSGAENYNPACLVQAREKWELEGLNMWVQLGQSGYSPYLKLNGMDQGYSYTAYTTIGSLIPLGNRITVGVNIETANDWLLVLDLQNGPKFVRYVPSQQPTISAGLGVKITKKFSIGYTLNTTLHINATNISVDLNTILASMGLSFGDPATDLNPNIEIDVLPGNSYQFGALYRPFRWLGVGVNYSYKIGSDFYIPIYLPPGLLPETKVVIEGNTFYRPSQIAFGVGVYPDDRITVSFDLAYDMWSQTKQWRRYISSDPDLFNVPYPDVKLKDIWVPRLGVEFRDRLKGKFSRMEYSFRAGYSFYKSPWPPMPADTTDIDNDAHTFSGGLNAGYYPKKRFKYIGIDVFWEYISLVKRSHIDISRQPAVIVSEGYVIYSGFALSMKM